MRSNLLEMCVICNIYGSTSYILGNKLSFRITVKIFLVVNNKQKSGLRHVNFLKENQDSITLIKDSKNSKNFLIKYPTRLLNSRSSLSS